MAQVPTLEQNVFPEQGPLPQANGADFGGQIGQAQQGLGDQLQNTGNVIAKDVLQWQGLKNEATAQDLAVQFQGDLGKIEEGYYGLSGKAAADAYPKFQSDVQALQQKYLGIAPNPMVANMVGGTVKFSVGRSLMSGGRYAGEQTKSWMIDSADGHAQLLAYQAGKNWNDPNFRETAFAAIDAAAQNLGEQKNWSPETTQLYAQKLKDQADKAAIDARKQFLQGQQPWKVIAALGGGDAGSGGTQPTAANIDDVAATMRGKEGDVRGYKTPGGGAYQVHGGPVDENSTPAEQDAFFKAEFPKRMDQLASNLGHQVTQADGSLAWQQGVGGATALLKHPDENAVAALVGAGVPEAIAVKSVEQNGGSRFQTAAEFTQHVKGYYGLPDTAQATGQTTLTPSQMAQANSPGEDSQIKAAFDGLPPDEQQAMRKSVLESWNSQNAAFRADTNFQQEQQAKLDKADLDKHVNAANQVIEANWANPSKNPPLDVAKLAAADPWYAAHPEAITAILNYRKNLDNKPDEGDAVTSQLYRGFLDGTKTVADFQEAYAPKDGSPGSISKTNLDFLMKSAEGKDNPETVATNKLKDKFLSDNDQSIGAGGNAINPDSEYRFNYDFQQAWDAKIAKGENPKDLVTPGNKDYFGNLSNLALYSHTAADLLAEQQDAQAEIDNPTLFGSPLAYLQKTADAIRQYGYGESGLPGEPTQAGVSLPAGIPEGSILAGKSKSTGVDLYRLPKALGGGLVAAGSPPAASAGQ